MDKNFIPYLYSQPTIPSMIKHYCGPMLTDPNLLTRMKASRLLEYRAALLDTEFKKNLKKVFGAIYDELVTAYPHHTLFFELFGRIKSMFSTINKLEELEEATLEKLHCKLVSQLFSTEMESITNEEERKAFLEAKIAEMKQNEQYIDEFNNRLTDKKFVGENPFERVHDFFAFRIVLEDMEANELIPELYNIANMVIEHFYAEGFDVIDHYPLLETGKVPKHDKIFVPKQSLINPKFKKKIKDYVKFPKKSGYQGIHIVVLDPFTGRMFEVQIRTRSMDVIAETLASHDAYKAEKYGTQQAQESEIDYSKIHVRCFQYIEYEVAGEKKTYISDTAGIKKHVDIIHEKHGY